MRSGVISGVALQLLPSAAGVFNAKSRDYWLWLVRPATGTDAGTSWLSGVSAGKRQSVAALSQLPPPIRPLLLQLPCLQPDSELLAILQDAWLICALPPAVRQQGPEHYPAVLNNLAQLALQAKSAR